MLIGLSRCPSFVWTVCSDPNWSTEVVIDMCMCWDNRHLYVYNAFLRHRCLEQVLRGCYSKGNLISFHWKTGLNQIGKNCITTPMSVTGCLCNLRTEPVTLIATVFIADEFLVMYLKKGQRLTCFVFMMPVCHVISFVSRTAMENGLRLAMFTVMMSHGIICV